MTFVLNSPLSLYRQLRHKHLNLYFMYYFTETILPLLFTALSIYFASSVIRLFIHLLICNEHGNN